MLLGGDASGRDVAGGAVEVGSGTSVAGEGGSLTLGAGDSEAIQGGSVDSRVVRPEAEWMVHPAAPCR